MRPCFLVTNQSAVLLAVYRAGFPTGLPINFIAAPEQQVDARIARFFDIVALIARPVFVMSDRDECFVFLEIICAEPIGINTRDIGDVVSILL